MRVDRYRQVADEIAQAIRSGAVPAGTRLPTHRELAKQHHIALATATKVYRELATSGLVVGEPGRGTFVRELSGFAGIDPRRMPRGARAADLSFNQPLSPEQGDTLRHVLRQIAAEGDLDSLLAQQPPGGRTADRAAMATHLLDRGIDVPPDRVILTSGAQQGLDVVLAALAPPGTVVAVDALTYPGIKPIAALRGIDLAPIRVGAEGTDVDHLEWLCRHRPISSVYLMPTIQNPLGFVLDAEARCRIAELAHRHDFRIVEDATYAFLDPHAPPPLQNLAPERTFHVGSMSKNLATGLRVGYVVGPAADRQQLVRALRAASWGTPNLTTTIVTRWIADGTVGRVERARRDDARLRQAIARRELAGLDYRAHPGSFSGWIQLPVDTRADIIVRELAAQGVLVSTADAFAVTPEIPNALRIALAGPTRDDLAHALALLRTTVTSSGALPTGSADSPNRARSTSGSSQRIAAPMPSSARGVRP